MSKTKKTTKLAVLTADTSTFIKDRFDDYVSLEKLNESLTEYTPLKTFNKETMEINRDIRTSYDSLNMKLSEETTKRTSDIDKLKEENKLLNEVLQATVQMLIKSVKAFCIIDFGLLILVVLAFILK